MAVTADQLTKSRCGDLWDLPVEEAVTIYQETLVFVNAAGYAVPTTASGVNAFAGISRTNVDNSAGADGDKTVELLRKGQFLLTGSGFAQGDVGSPVYASDNYTITKTRATAAVYCGKITGFVSTTQVWVEIDPKIMPDAAIANASGDAVAEANTIIDVLERHGMIISS